MKLIETSGGEIVFGGKANTSVKHIEPTIILNPSKDSHLLEEEIFGPVLPILTYKNFDEVVDYINDRPKPLAVYFYGKPNHKEALRLQDETSSGAVCVNDCFMQIISHYQGFGGVGDSGNGRYGGYEGFKQFSNRKGQFVRSAQPSAARSLMLPPFTDQKLSLVNKVFLFASLHTQYQVYWWMRTLLLLSAIWAGYYYFKK
jgi:aldehyde dehydrogenase (NAD+)